MARYVQRIKLLGKERWIGWEIDGIGTEIAGLTLADEMSDEELRARGIKEFNPMPFETFLGMGGGILKSDARLLNEDVSFRLDSLQVAMERYRSRGVTEIPRLVLTGMFGDNHLDDPRIFERFQQWESAGWVEVVGREDCFLRIRSRIT